MRIKQYVLITDYSLWEVILNGDSPTPTRIVYGVVQVIDPTTAEQRLAKKNKLTLLIAFPDKHQLKFNIHKDAKSFMEAIEKRFRGNKETKKGYSYILPNFNSISDAVIYSFFANQCNSPQLDNEDLKQINSDDLEEMDLKWQMDMLTMRARRFLKRTGRNLGANGTNTIGFDMSKVECYNCHRRGHFTRECRSSRDNRNKDPPRRTVPVEVPTSNALVSQCLSSSLGSDNENETMFEDDIELLKLNVLLRDNALAELRKKFKQAKKERDDLKLILEKFQTSSKNLSKLLEGQVYDKTGLGYDSQVFNRQMFDYEELHSPESDDSMPTSLENDRYKTGEGYRAVLPPSTGIFMPSKPNLVFKDAPMASESVTNVFNVKSSTHKPSKDMYKTFRPDALIIKDLTSDSEDENEIEPVSTAVFQSTVKSLRPVKHVVNKAHSPIRRPINYRPATKNSNFYKKVTTIKVNKVNAVKGNKGNAEKALANWDNPKQALKDKGVIDSGCSKHMTGNISFLLVFKEINEGYVAFRGNPKGATKDETSGILKTFITGIENQINHKDKIIRCDNGTEFKNHDLNQFCGMKGIKREFSVARTPQQNRVVERKNRTLIEAARTMLADPLLPISFWAEAVNTACYVQNRVLVTKRHNKTPYELLLSRSPSIGFMRPFGCLVTILNTLDLLGKFDGKADEGFLVGYSVNSKEFRVFNRNQPNDNAGIKENFVTGKVRKETVFVQQYNENEVHVSPNGSDKTKKHDDKAKNDDKGKSHVDLSTGVRDLRAEFEDFLLYLMI
nr:ribonuclease H-like domain-containing protein [Tanacetum cinerariifolium]